MSATHGHRIGLRSSREPRRPSDFPQTKTLAQDATSSQVTGTDTVTYWSGTGPYPNIKVRMDFRGPVTGDFVYHCHILGHEDAGMMAIIRVLPKPDHAESRSAPAHHA